MGDWNPELKRKQTFLTGPWSAMAAKALTQVPQFDRRREFFSQGKE